MNKISNEQLLSQLQALKGQASGGVLEKPSEAGFDGMLSKAIDKVNDLQQESGRLKKAYEMGDPSVHLIDTMIASQKSGIAFQMMLQTRNKLVEAYRQIWSMPL